MRGTTTTTTDIDGDVDCLLDVRNLDAFRSVIAETGVPDLLFSNAGVSMGGQTHELTRAHRDRAIDVNLNGVVNGLLAVYPGMVERGPDTSSPPQATVVAMVGDGMTPEEILDDLPYLEPADIDEALQFAADQAAEMTDTPPEYR